MTSYQVLVANVNITAGPRRPIKERHVAHDVAAQLDYPDRDLKGGVKNLLEAIRLRLARL